ncbi:MAG TPA: DUF4870 domain-containing protein [Steroidobacteraceae bacterium]|jgi:uncharacterized Tic20 family protein|nr:DUF4870 domain-containing protein [Steroidobacteraceae bacterium]
MNLADSVPDPTGVPTQDERTWGMVAHLAALGFFVVPFVGNILGPLVVLLAKREHSAFVALHAKEALNFNITFLLGAFVCGLLVAFSIGILFGALLFIFWLVMTVIAALKANEGAAYRYPFSVRLVK